MAADQQPTVATNGGPQEPVSQLVRRLLGESEAALDKQIRIKRTEGEQLVDELADLELRREAVQTAYQLPDEMLERLVREVGASLHTPPAFEERS